MIYSVLGMYTILKQDIKTLKAPYHFEMRYLNIRTVYTTTLTLQAHRTQWIQNNEGPSVILRSSAFLFLNFAGSSPFFELKDDKIQNAKDSVGR